METKKILGVGIIAALFSTASIAANYPEKTVTIVVPFPAGGTTDILARQVAKGLTDVWNKPVIVENRGGASGIIGSGHVVKSKPDGYTLMITATHHIINPSLQKEHLTYDTKNDFTSLNMIATVPSVLVANKKFEADSVQELINYAKDKPGQLDFASTGIGGANHLAGELFAHMAEIKINHIPYRGGGPALTDVLAGQVPIMFDSVPAVISHIKSGDLKALGVTTKERVAMLPDTPTIEEQGVKDFEAVSMFGLYGPAEMPSELIEEINDSVNKALSTDEIKAQFDNLGAVPGDMNQPEFTEYVNFEIDKWKEVIDSAGIKLEK